jgi:hypothetical protein
MKKLTGLLLALVALGACRVEDSTRPNALDVQGPAQALSDGTSGGNPDFFFFQPLTANPLGHPNIDQGADNPFLAPFAIICEVRQNPAPGLYDCLDDVTPVAGGIPLTLSGDNYSNSWRTSDGPGLASNKFYRIEVFAAPVLDRESLTQEFIDKFRYGFRDIDPDNGPSVSACATEAFCKINNGSTIPIKVRIEKFASCPDTQACVSEVVRANQQNNLKQPSGNQITVPGQTSDLFLNFDVCTAAEEAALDGAIDLPTFGPCLKTETPFTGTLSAPAILSICEPIDFIPEAQWPHEQQETITLHHFHTVGTAITKVEALPEANNCTTVTGDAGAQSGLTRLARHVVQSLSSFLNPRELHAAAALDVGGGGFTFELGSLFKLALAGKFEYLDAADASRTAPPGSNVTLQAKVTDLSGNPIFGARVHWTVISAPGTGATLSATPSFTDANGVAQVVVALPQRTGTTVVHATGKGIADARATGCTILNPADVIVAASCDGPRGSFDPFLPKKLNPDLEDGPAVQLAGGTRLTFSITTGSRR